MLHGGIEMIGPFYAEGLDELPTWTPKDEKRVVYSNTSHRIYLGTNVGWKDISGSGDVLLDTDTVDGLHASTEPKENTLLALDNSKELPTSAKYLNWHMSSHVPSAGCIPVMNEDGKVNASITGDAATLGGLPSSSFVRTDADSTIDQHKLTIVGSEGQMNVAIGSRSALEIRPINGATEPAMISFNRTGTYSCYFGLDTDNKLKYGGLSLGNSKYEIWTANNMGHNSGLNADTCDTFHASATPTPYYLLPLDKDGKFPIGAFPKSAIMPVGTICFFPMNISGTMSESFLPMIGQQTLSKTTYAALYYYLTDGGTTSAYFGESGNVFFLPNWSGYHFRMRWSANSVDPNYLTRIVPGGTRIIPQWPGSLQNDIIQKHIHPCGGAVGTAGGGTGVVDHQAWDNSYYNYYTRDFDVVSDKNQGSLDAWSATGVARGAETRPKNVYVEVGIKYI